VRPAGNGKVEREEVGPVGKGKVEVCRKRPGNNKGNQVVSVPSPLTSSSY
jgi:hypothetical protein